ncbi:hypothetical protein EV659_10988 [Rhodothalassium salexigens DSM 2132]|uniref:Uncharacterized protein n=1 Tax=Rhodothalassium salexigens DSM 2132 TaxID=1188247 RepID=A0A4V2SNV2_RHOSA|nr:hypothetical protein [Rhodothalassium salexigens]MBB4212253.1 hypothetical protein [Rhodothalassium salexigens DSM 2132]TCP32596.1 hypothetical protein EV659_10988 [Rhodothalassium salexigens DSM 2132]
MNVLGDYWRDLRTAAELLLVLRPYHCLGVGIALALAADLVLSGGL